MKIAALTGSYKGKYVACVCALNVPVSMNIINNDHNYCGSAVVYKVSAGLGEHCNCRTVCIYCQNFWKSVS